MELVQEITYGTKGQVIETFLIDETKTDENSRLIENKKFKSLFSYGRYLDKIKENYGTSLVILPTVVSKSEKVKTKIK